MHLDEAVQVGLYSLLNWMLKSALQKNLIRYSTKHKEDQLMTKCGYDLACLDFEVYLHTDNARTTQLLR